MTFVIPLAAVRWSLVRCALACRRGVGRPAELFPVLASPLKTAGPA